MPFLGLHSSWCQTVVGLEAAIHKEWDEAPPRLRFRSLSHDGGSSREPQSKLG